MYRILCRLAIALFAALFLTAAGMSTAGAGGFPTSFVPGDYPTNHFDDKRTGWNPYETVLTTANVNATSFGQLWQAQIDSRVYAQPIVAMAETVGGQTHNVVFVATLNDTLYAFDADTGVALWTRTLQNPPGAVTVPMSFFGNCLTFAPSVGVVSTPVYDRSTHSLYAVAATLEGPSGQQQIDYRLHQISVADGTDLQPNVLITGSSTDNTGQLVQFAGNVQAQRPGLLASNGYIYVGFGSFDDFYKTQSRGWIFAYNAATFAQVGSWVSTRMAASDGTLLGSLWAGGFGIAADDSGNVFLATGNGLYAPPWDYGDSVIELAQNLAGGPISSFTPGNAIQLAGSDLDLGSGGPLLMPPLPGIYPNLLWVDGKNDVAYLLNRDKLGGLSTPTARGFIRSIPTHAIFGGPAFYQDGAGSAWIFSSDHSTGSAYLAQYAVRTGSNASAYSVTLTARAPVPFGRLGGVTPVVSSNGSIAGSAIVWYLDRPVSTGPVPLYAFDASNITKELFAATAGQWSLYGSGALIQPTVTNGKAYVATDKMVTAFGLLSGHATISPRRRVP